MFDDFDQLIAQPTNEIADKNQAANEFDFNQLEFGSLEFEEPEEREIEEFEEQEKEVIDLTPYDPVEAANNLVSLLTLPNILIISPLAAWKLQKKRGGKKKIATLRQSLLKQEMGDELTDVDKQRIKAYLSYEKDMAKLESAIPFTTEEIETLVQQAIPYCRTNRVNIGGSNSFWVTYSAFQAQRIIQILQA